MRAADEANKKVCIHQVTSVEIIILLRNGVLVHNNKNHRQRSKTIKLCQDPSFKASLYQGIIDCIQEE